ncbi:hypothetical protein MRS44_017121 [Fusarium solani]|uniref:uncharacterized protein n=1 Tax=Fusarium solani TaxID=169388 RepID=UPI0032C42A48|nr:hypothetical protein MRS44_017121 [Fusarium solani]
MSPASPKISPRNLKSTRLRVSPSPSGKSEQSQTERIEDTIFCAPLESRSPIDEDENELGEQLTQRSIPFEAVIQNETDKHIIIQYPRGHGSWFILRCQEHDLDFRNHPLRAASAHLRSRQHGRLQDTTGPAVIEHFGIKVLNCNEELAQMNNAATLKFKPAIKRSESRHVDVSVPAELVPRESVPDESAPEESVLEQPVPEEPASEAVPEAVPEESPLEEPTREKSAQEEPVPEESTPRQKRRKLSSAPCDLEDEVPPAKDEPMQEPSHDPIISPTPGIVYLAYRETTKTWLPALVLPWNNLGKVGLSTTLESLGLTENVPKCYVYDPGTTYLEWKAQYEDSGALVAQRQFPVVYFDSTAFPSKDAAGWVGTGGLQELDLSDASACLEPHFSLARDFFAKRLGMTGDCKSLSALVIPDVEDAKRQQPSPQATPKKIESPVLTIPENLPAKEPVVASVIAEKEVTPPVETPTTEPSREAPVESDSKPSVTTESPSEPSDPKPITGSELLNKPELISNSESISNSEPVANPEPIHNSKPIDDSELISSSELISKPEPIGDTEATNSPEPISNLEPISITEHTDSPVLINGPEPIGNSEPINNFEPISHPELVSKPEPINIPEPANAFESGNSPEPMNICNREVSIENQASRRSESRSHHTAHVVMVNQHTYSPASTYVDPRPTPPASEIQSHRHRVERALLNHMSADLFQLKTKSTTLIFPKAVFDLETLQSTLPPIQQLPNMQGHSQALRPISDQMGSPAPSINQAQSFSSQATQPSMYSSPAPQHTPASIPRTAPATTIKRSLATRKPVPTQGPVHTPRPLAPRRPAAVEEAEPRFGETLYGVPECILQGVRRWLRTTEKNPKISEFCLSDGLYRCPWCHKRFARPGIFTDHLSLKHDERPKPPEIRPDHR